MSKTVIKAIVWDLDGTLIHFRIDWIKARREAIKVLKKVGVPKHLLTIKSSILENVGLAREFFKNSGMADEEIEKIFSQVDQIVNEIEYEAAQQATAVDGIKEVLDYLSKNNFKQAIYTFNTYRNATTSLKKTELLQYFDVIVGRDHVKNTKPHPEHLNLICKKLNLLPSNIIVIGDNHRDIEGAFNVGAKSIAIKTKLTKLTNLEILQQANHIIEENEIPTKLIPTIKDLL